jgi:alpha-tubulin suppressor-like RCC1 family protein
VKLGREGKRKEGPAQAPQPAPAFRASPPLPPGLSASAISTGERHTCALVSGGEVKCWGWNIYGQLGIGSTTDQTSTVTVPGATGWGLGFGGAGMGAGRGRL